jgi:hypothetical protein
MKVLNNKLDYILKMAGDYECHLFWANTESSIVHLCDLVCNSLAGIMWCCQKSGFLRTEWSVSFQFS